MKILRREKRTQILMDVANKSGGLVIGTGDMSELALGWATYNGDHMSMYGVNAGVPKNTHSFTPIDYEAKRTNNDILKKTLQDILDTPVSPELLRRKTENISKDRTYCRSRMNFTISFYIILCVLVQSRQRYED